MFASLGPLVYVLDAGGMREFQVENEGVANAGLGVMEEGKASLSTSNSFFYGVRRKTGEDKVRICQYADSGTQAQRWRAIKNSDGSITLRSVLAPPLVLDVSGGVAANESNVQVYEQNSTAAQSFFFERVE